ncbi:MAG: hypothetical protein LBU22_03195 [Dysgonamonadaceae bacterium]|jgi:hypothetical protein|nr:hypothetical protein [Dysgonamonadaceae bacterium]
MKAYFFSAFMLASIFFIGCSDHDTDGSKNYNAKDFIEELSEKSKQTFDLNTTQLPKTLELKGGTKITISPGTFTKNGIPVTGNFTVEVREILKPSDIIFSGTNTNYKDGSPLLSDGFLYIDVTQGDGSVDKVLSKNLQIEISKPIDVNRATFLWEGIENAGEGENQFAWDNFPEDGVVMNDTGQNGRDAGMAWGEKGSVVFVFDLGKLGWFNCDIYWDSSNGRTTVYVTLTGVFGALAAYQGYVGDTFVFFCGRGDKVISQLYTQNGKNGVKSYDNSMPKGKIGKLIAFSIKDGIFSYASQDNVTITENMNLTLDLKETTKEFIQAEIEALDNF